MKIKDFANGLHGHVQVFVKNKKTNQTTLWSESDNVITISGYQNILLRSFGLRLDSRHDVPYIDGNIGKDTNLITPDLNELMNIGEKPSSYTTMEDEFSSSHIIQGFMVGNGGAGEDNITTKNTNYSFVNLRRPIPFRQTTTVLPSDVAGQYLGIYNKSTAEEEMGYAKSYFIKKFDDIPHMYHTWWKEGQKWSYVDPVSQDNLGPNQTASPKTDRIASYIECQMSISPEDCIDYFSHAGSTQTPVINEIGLVAFDAEAGTRSVFESTYKNYIKEFIEDLYKKDSSLENLENLTALALTIYNILVEDEVDITSFGNSNINEFISVIAEIKDETDPSAITENQLTTWRDTLSSSTNINVEAYYNQNGTYVYETDEFLNCLHDSVFDTLTNDEAQRIKLITYYTFNSIPLSDEVEILINYRIYTN